MKFIVCLVVVLIAYLCIVDALPKQKPTPCGCTKPDCDSQCKPDCDCHIEPTPDCDSLCIPKPDCDCKPQPICNSPVGKDGNLIACIIVEAFLTLVKIFCLVLELVKDAAYLFTCLAGFLPEPLNCVFKYIFGGLLQAGIDISKLCPIVNNHLRGELCEQCPSILNILPDAVPSIPLLHIL